MSIAKAAQRQRMYVFERAWKDYAAKANSSYQKVRSVGEAIVDFYFGKAMGQIISATWIIVILGLGLGGPMFPGMWFWSRLGQSEYEVVAMTMAFATYYFAVTVGILGIEALWKAIRKNFPWSRAIIAVLLAVATVYVIVALVDDPLVLMKTQALLAVVALGLGILANLVGRQGWIIMLALLAAVVLILAPVMVSHFWAFAAFMMLMVTASYALQDPKNKSAATKQSLDLIVSSQAVGAALAVATVVALSVAAGAAASLVFGLYFVALMAVVTVLLVPLAAFGLLRLIYMGYRKIAYKCPAAGCPETGLPAFVCPDCHTRYTDLYPSFYGVFHHRCDHTDGTSRKLPTLDILGRWELAKECRSDSCRHPLNGKSKFKHPQKLIFIAGGPGTGKSVYTLMTSDALTKGCQVNGDRVTAEYDIPMQQAQINGELARINSGLMPDGTRTDREAVSLLVSKGQKKNLIYLYDKTGEIYTKVDMFGGTCKEVEHLDGLIVLVDPFSLSGLSSQIHKLSDDISVSTTPFDNVVDTLKRIPSLLGKGRKDIPVAVVVTKADIDTVRNVVCDPVHGGSADEAVIRSALQGWGATNAINGIESTFGSNNVRYFACSALGRAPGADSTRPFEPRGTVEPILWCLQESN